MTRTALNVFCLVLVLSVFPAINGNAVEPGDLNDDNLVDLSDISAGWKPWQDSRFPISPRTGT